jgi:tripartite-type tricarboxylate transporter receptor subunit TctC
LPAGTPEPILRRFEAAIRRTAEDPEFQAQAARDYLIVRHMDQAAMTAFVQAQDRHYADLWHRSPWR